jgi:peptide chain release factor subunit 1
MLTLKNIHGLGSRPERHENSVLTLYLDTDQSKQANLNRGFERRLHEMAANIKTTIHSPEDRNRFESASVRMNRLVQESDAHARGLVAVFDAADGYLWCEQVHVPLPNRLQWSRQALVEPLVAALEEYETVGIVLLDRAHIRVLTMFLGEVHEHIHKAFDQRKVRHTKTAGMDKVGAASHAQQKAGEQVRQNLRHMMREVEFVVAQQNIQRLLLAGSSEITAEFRTLLPKRLASLVVGAVDIDINANSREIGNAVAPIAETFEREGELKIVTNLVTSAAKTARAVVGLTRTLDAVNQSRVWQLIYADGFHAPGYECGECAALFSSRKPSCPLCGSSLHRIDNVVEHAVARAMRKGAKVETVRSANAESSLMKAGGIGAILRTRTAA